MDSEGKVRSECDSTGAKPNLSVFFEFLVYYRRVSASIGGKMFFDLEEHA